MSRCSDKSPTVRSRALTVLSATAADNKPSLVSAVRRAILSQAAVDPLVATPLPASSSSTHPSRNVIIPMVRRRTSDEKVGVRKAAVQALEAIIRLDLDNICREVSLKHCPPTCSCCCQSLTQHGCLVLCRTWKPFRSDVSTLQSLYGSKLSLRLPPSLWIDHSVLHYTGTCMCTTQVNGVQLISC